MTTQTGTQTKRLNANIPADTHRDFQIACIQQGEDMTAVLINYMKSYISKNHNSKGSKK